MPESRSSKESSQQLSAPASKKEEHNVKSKAKVKATPLPKMKMLAVAVTLLAESVCSTTLLPFVGLYVAHLKNISPEQAGYFSGIIVGLFMLGQMISSKLWGWLSDTYGRKPPLTMGLFAGAFAMLFFGMAPNIYVCCIMRFIHGFFNGNVLIAKIIISDITDSTNAALGFSMVGLLWCVGSVFGPAIGGFLYDPLVNKKLQWMHVQADSFLGRNPAFLPSLFIFIYTMTSFFICLIVLPETNLHRTKSIRNVPVIGWVLNAVRPKAVTIVTVTDTTTAENETPAAPKPPAMTYAKALKDPVILTITILYMCIACTDMATGQVIPLWAIASPEAGGLGMFSDAVGVLMLFFAVPTFVSNLFFAKVYKAMDNSGLVWRVFSSSYIIIIILLPFAVLAGTSGAFWYVLVFGSLRNSASSVCYNLVHLETARAAPPGTVGSVYGISQSMAVVVRCIVPFLAAPLFAWSISGHHAFPFNHYFVFFISIIPLCYSIYLTLRRRIIRTPEELAAWGLDKDGNPKKDDKKGEEGHNDDQDDEEEDEDGRSTQRSVAEDYRSLAGSFGHSQSDMMMANLPVLEAENERQGQVADWIRRTAPRGRGQRLHSAAKTLQHEDWRLTCDERIEEEEEDEKVG
eukprot:gene12208-biopygen8942